MASFTIKQDGENYLTLSVLSKLAPYAWDSWDGNRVRIRVDYAVAGKSATYDAILFTSDLESFRDELAGDVVDDSGLIALTTVDGVVYVTLERVGNDFAVDCSISKTPDGPQDARLNLRIPISDVRIIIDQLDSILLLYPVIGPHGAAERGRMIPPSPN